MIKRKPVILLVSLLLGMALFGVGCSKGATAKSGDTVKVDYTLKLSDGTVYDSSEDSEPLEFILGQNQVIAGFEKAIIGMKVGESKTVTILADEAYGQRRDDLLLSVERSKLPQELELKVGQQLQGTNADGTTTTVIITKIDETRVTLDANHPLAGKDLTFEIKLVEIKSK